MECGSGRDAMLSLSPTDSRKHVCRLVEQDETLLHKGLPGDVGWSRHHDVPLLQSFLRG